MADIHAEHPQAEREQPDRAHLRARRRARLRGGGRLGQDDGPGVPREIPAAPHADARGREPAARNARRELRDHGVPLQQARPRRSFYPRRPGERAMVNNAMFYLIGTFYPLLTRATYPTLGFPQYAGEVGTSEADDDMKAKAQQDAEAALADPLEAFQRVLPRRPAVRRRRLAVDRGHPLGGDARVPARDRLRRSPTGPRSTCSAWRRRSATRTRSRRPTCAATSIR